MSLFKIGRVFTISCLLALPSTALIFIILAPLLLVVSCGILYIWSILFFAAMLSPKQEVNEYVKYRDDPEPNTKDFSRYDKHI